MSKWRELETQELYHAVFVWRSFRPLSPICQNPWTCTVTGSMPVKQPINNDVFPFFIVGLLSKWWSSLLLYIHHIHQSPWNTPKSSLHVDYIVTDKATVVIFNWIRTLPQVTLDIVYSLYLCKPVHDVFSRFVCSIFFLHLWLDISSSFYFVQQIKCTPAAYHVESCYNLDVRAFQKHQYFYGFFYMFFIWQSWHFFRMLLIPTTHCFILIYWNVLYC